MSTATGTIFTSGGVSGSLGSTVTMTDNSFFSFLIQGFTRGSTLSFLAHLTTNIDLGGTPDAFAFSVLDAGFLSIPTMDPSGADTLLSVNIDSVNPTIFTYGTDPTRNTLGGSGPAITMGAPVITSAVPEPSSLLLLCTGLGGVSFAAWRRKKIHDPSAISVE